MRDSAASWGDGARAELPTGTVTFLMTDVEGSTRLWETQPESAGAVIERHDEIIGATVAEHHGALLKTKGEGDSTFSVFADANDAVTAAIELQRSLRREPWHHGNVIRVRAALYTGAAELRAGDYYGVTPNRGGRLRAVAHGGQSICSHATKQLVTGPQSRSLPSGTSLHNLGLHRLRDLDRAERVYQLNHPDLPTTFPPLRSLGVRHNLPAPRTSFVGRDHERAALKKHLETGRLVTLTGVGGCGKTRLALDVAAEQLERYPDGVFFIDLAPVSDTAALPGAVAAAVGFGRFAIGTGSGQPSAELLEYLGPREALLIVDNCEHLIDASAALVDEVLERCPRVSILATSRESLDLQGEQLLPVPPLEVTAATGSDEGASLESDAVRLFKSRAALIRPDFAPSTADDVVVEICRRLDGIPLAIELAAAQLPHLALGEIAELLDEGFRISAGGRRRVSRHQTLHAALDWSHELLGAPERAVFRRLAAFPGSFDSEAAIAVCNETDAIELLRALVRKSLVVAEDDGAARRFRLLETVRAYADDRLDEAGEVAMTRDRHRDHFLAWAEAIPPELTYLDPNGSMRRESHNLRAALAWSETQRRRDLIGRLASTMNRMWLGDIREGRRWLALGMEAAQDLGSEHRVRLMAVAAHTAVLAIEARDGELARRAVEASAGPGMWSSLGHALLCLNAGIRNFWTKEDRHAEDAERLGRQAVELATGPLSLGLAWFWLGQARVLLGDLDGAIDALEKGSVEAIPGGDMSPVSLAMLAGTLHLVGRHDEALAAATEVFERAGRFQDSGLWAWSLYCSLPYALELAQHGRHTEARAFMRDLLEESGTPLTPGVMTSAVIVLAAMAHLRGEHETAGVLVDYAGRAIMESGVRTPVDIALHAHYLDVITKARNEHTASRNREQAARMELPDAIALGLASS